MRIIKITFAIFFTGFLISCQEIENLDLEEIEEKFERFDNFNFQYQNSNVTRIKAIGDRLFYAHKTNPGFISKDMEVIPLCCLSNNQMDFRQSFSNDYVAAVGQDLSFFNIFRVDGSLNFGFLSLNGLLEHLGDRITVTTFGWSELGNFDINGSKMAVNLQFGFLPTQYELYIFDLEKNTNFVGIVPDSSVIRVEFPGERGGENANNRVYKLDTFRDGWIASASIAGLDFKNYFISKEGIVQEFTIPTGPMNFYTGHDFTSNGKLLINGFRQLYISGTGKLEDLRLFADFDNIIRMRLVEDRIVVWNTNFDILYELENYESDDPDQIKLRRLSNKGIEFAGLNEIQVFNGKVFVATSQGLFTKSLERFWDSALDIEMTNQEQEFLEGIRFH